MISLTSETPLGGLNVTDLLMVPSPLREEGDVLAFVLLDPRECNNFVPYIILEGGKRGHVYNSPPSMNVRRVEPNSHRLPPIQLVLFNYGELSGSPKFSLEYGRINHDQVVAQNPPSQRYQLSLL